MGPFAGSVLAVLLYQFFKHEFVMSEGLKDEDEGMEEVKVVKADVVEESVKKPVRKPAARKTATRKTTKK